MNSDINHTEEMEPAYHEAYMAIGQISQAVRDMTFAGFCCFVEGIGKRPVLAKLFNDMAKVNSGRRYD